MHYWVALKKTILKFTLNHNSYSWPPATEIPTAVTDIIATPFLLLQATDSSTVNTDGAIIFTFVPCILILSKFYLITNWCTSELS